MPFLTKHDHMQLITRARAALETPADLTAEDVGHLIEDLGHAETLLATHDVPWTLDIHVGHIDHRYGANIYAALSRAALMAEIAEFCREWWKEIEDARDPQLLSDEDVSSIYFEAQHDEYLSTDRLTLDGPEMAQPIPVDPNTR